MIDIDEKQVGTDDSGRLIIEWDLDAAERSGETAKLGTQRNVEVLDGLTNTELAQRLKQALE
jgi:hypothetical protein